MEFIWPNNVNKNVPSHLLRSRLSNNLNSLKIFDLESTKPVEERIKLGLSFVKKKV